MNQFIVVTSTLIELNQSVEDEKLRDITSKRIGEAKVLINISQIEQAFEYDGGAAITLISGVQIQTKEPFDELLTKISTSQIKSRIN